ncbi:hypothetical protein [Burkholderia glumae]
MAARRLFSASRTLNVSTRRAIRASRSISSSILSDSAIVQPAITASSSATPAPATVSQIWRVPRKIVAFTRPNAS